MLEKGDTGNWWTFVQSTFDVVAEKSIVDVVGICWVNSRIVETYCNWLENNKNTFFVFFFITKKILKLTSNICCYSLG